MLNIDYKLSVPGFKVNEIGSGTLIRAHNANLRIELVNNEQTYLRKLNVRPALESYIGQDKPILFLWSETQIIDEIPPKSMVPLTFRIWANYPGLIAIAIHVTDASNNAVMAKRPSETAYNQSPVRYWFYVVDNISIQTLRALKAVLEQKPKETKK